MTNTCTKPTTTEKDKFTRAEIKEFIDIERKVIHLMLKSRDAIREVQADGIRAEFFKDNPCHYLIVKAVFDTFADHEHLLTLDAYRLYVIKNGQKNVTVFTEEFAKCDVGAYAVMDDLPRLREMLRDQYLRRTFNGVLRRAVPSNGDARLLMKDILANNLPILQDALTLATGKTAVSVCAADIEIDRPTWIWNSRIQAGTTNLIAGDPGLGKSAITLDIAARVTTGAPMPFTGESVKGRVLILSCEDAKETTIAPRLYVAGADMSQVEIIDPSHIRGLDTDLYKIERRLHDLGDVRLLIIDPITAFMGEKKPDTPGVRSLLAPITQLAEKYGVAVWMIMHYRKQPGRPMDRVSGNAAWVQTVRSGLCVDVDKADPNLRHLHSIKTSNVARSKSVTFRTIEKIVPAELVKSKIAFGVVAIEWGSETEFTSDDFDSTQSSSKLEDALCFLQEALADGPRLQTELATSAKQQGISWATLKRAKDELRKQNILQCKLDKFGGKWQWSLAGQEMPTTSTTPIDWGNE